MPDSGQTINATKVARMGPSAPVHLNGNIFCAVDVETTGLDSSKHDTIEICILPIKADYTINKEILPFHARLKPRRPENADPEAMSINKVTLSEIIINGLDPYRVADYLIEWFEKLNLGQYKHIVPIAQNWPFDRSFIEAWLGRLSYELVFDKHFRDTMATALFLNDRAEMIGRPIPYPKVNLKYLCSTLGIEQPDAHTAVGDCIATAEVYRRLLTELY